MTNSDRESLFAFKEISILAWEGRQQRTGENAESVRYCTFSSYALLPCNKMLRIHLEHLIPSWKLNMRFRVFRPLDITSRLFPRRLRHPRIIRVDTSLYIGLWHTNRENDSNSKTSRNSVTKQRHKASPIK